MERRQFVRSIASACATTGLMPEGGTHRPRPVLSGATSEWRDEFPALSQRLNGQPLTYLDTAATSLRPRAVLDALRRFDAFDNANPGATLHTLARGAAAAMDDARRTAAGFIGATDPLEIVLTRGTTDGINLVAATWGPANLAPGDEILVGIGEHASNLLPWRALAARTGARVTWFGLDDAGHPDERDLRAKLGPRTRIVAMSHVSNVLGLVNPVERLCALARAPGRIVVVDAAQSAPHIPVDVAAIGCDFLALSSHKLCGPMGAGVLWGRRALLDAMPPYQFGSNMAHEVGLDGEQLSEGALKFGAGTPNASGAVGLAAAMRFLRGVGFDAIRAHQVALNRHLLERLRAIPAVRLLGAADAEARVGVFAFVAEGKAPAEIVRALDAEGIAIRAGDLAALPLLERFGCRAAARASCYLYTSVEDVDRFADALARNVGAG